jgi:ribosomal protection tetracycline resistance protein
VVQKELNLGIVAHVDAGKTTLTERLLYDAGVIDDVGSVDAGTTQTDSLALERERGITIRSAVASFALGDVHVNLIDTPGHPDFIAEVERVLSVLDGAILVVSAVEGVQPQTRVLMRALKRLRVPTLIFVNKTDRAGADVPRVLGALAERLGLAVVDLTSERSELAEVLAVNDDAILASYVDGVLSDERLREALASQTRRALVHPVCAGSALKGIGVDALTAAIAAVLPSASGDPDAPVDAIVFKIERGANGEKIAYVRMVAGTLHVRDRAAYGDGRDDTVTAIAVFARGGSTRQATVAAGAVARVWGLDAARIGDRIGGRRIASPHHFAPPTLESAVVVDDPRDGPRLRVALAELAEQDPLIDVRRNEADGELSVSLYGEVQREVIEETLARDYGIGATFRDATPLYVERPLGIGEGLEVLHAPTNPFNATLGIRIEPGTEGAGVELVLDVEARALPLFIYGTAEQFASSMHGYVVHALEHGLHGWRVTDALVTVSRCSYSVADGPPSRRGPTSTAADFRKLAPHVVAQALAHAGTRVCEPIVRASVEVPTTSLGVVVPAVARLGAAVDRSSLRGDLAVLEALLPVARAHELQRRLPGLTGGEGSLESAFAGYRALTGEQPNRLPLRSASGS